MVEQLTQEPELLSLEILRRARLDGLHGRQERALRAGALGAADAGAAVVRFEGLPGEFSQHDFGQVDVRFLDGTRKRVHFFASRLKYSRWAQVSLVPDERVETLVRALVDHFAAIGGIPLAGGVRPAEDDRADVGQVTAWSREWNPTFAGVALDLGLGDRAVLAA